MASFSRSRVAFSAREIDLPIMPIETELNSFIVLSISVEIVNNVGGGDSYLRRHHT